MENKASLQTQNICHYNQKEEIFSYRLSIQYFDSNTFCFQSINRIFIEHKTICK